MKIVSSFLPPIVNQPQGKTAAQSPQATEQPIQKGVAGESEERARPVVGELETLHEQNLSRRNTTNFRALQAVTISHHHLRALSNYESVATQRDESADTIDRLDIHV